MSAPKKVVLCVGALPPNLLTPDWQTRSNSPVVPEDAVKALLSSDGAMLHLYQDGQLVGSNGVFQRLMNAGWELPSPSPTPLIEFQCLRGVEITVLLLKMEKPDPATWTWSVVKAIYPE